MQLSDEHLTAWRKLLERLKRPETREQWAMETFYRKRECGTVGCLAFHACCANGSGNVVSEGQVNVIADIVLGFVDDEFRCVVSDHVYGGGWAEAIDSWAEITIDMAIAYVSKVIETRDPMTTIEV